MQDLNWGDLKYVLAVARSRSLAGAARLMGVNETTVARRIAQAEFRLEARLFERNEGEMHPTEAGAVAVAGAERVELEVQSVEGKISGADRKAAGSVRLTSVPIITNRILAPALPRLLKHHPRLKIELIADPRDLSLTKRESDIALRLARPQRDARAVTRRIGHLSYAVYGPARRKPELLPWITYVEAMADLPQARWIAAKAGRGHKLAQPLLVNDAETLIQSVRAGIGKSILPIPIGDREPGLVRLDDGGVAHSRELWLMVHPELRELVRIRVVIDWLVSVIDSLPKPDR